LAENVFDVCAYITKETFPARSVKIKETTGRKFVFVCYLCWFLYGCRAPNLTSKRYCL